MESLTVYLFSIVIFQTLAINVDIPNLVYEVKRGDNITIPCNFKAQKPDFKTVIITWMAHADIQTDPELNIVTLFYTKTETDVDYDEVYNGRATLDYNITRGIANLNLSSVTSKDTRVYECKVQIPSDTTGKPVDSTSLVVLVPPSKPICAIQGKTEIYQNISLSCGSDEGTPTPTYKWTNFDSSNNPRPNPLKSTDVNGVLTLYNISTENDGFFICTSTNKIGSNFCNLTLKATTPSMNVASTAGIIGGLVVCLLILLIVLYCCCCRKKKKEEAYVLKPTETAEYTDREHHEDVDDEREGLNSKPAMSEDQANRQDHYEERSEREHDRSRDRRDDRRDDYDDRRGRDDDRRDQYDSDPDHYDDRRSDRRDQYDDRDRYDDRRRDQYDDRRRDQYDDRRDQYDDRRNDRRDQYDDRRNDRRDQYDDRRDQYDDRRDQYDDRRNDRRDRYDKDRPPNVPANKPPRG